MRKAKTVIEITGVTDKVICLEEEEARELYEQLSDAFSLPKVVHFNCGDRYSHSPHAEIAKMGKMIKLCAGRSQDAT